MARGKTKAKIKKKGRARTDLATPIFVVETSLAGVVAPKLDVWLDDLDEAIPRVLHQTDGEAVHDLRVASRRIRSLMRVVRSVFGRFHVKRIRDGFKRVGMATGALRDEEVLMETIDALDLKEADRQALVSWRSRRGDRERTYRQSVIELIDSGALDAPRTELRALIRLPIPPERDKEAHKFARKVVFEAQAWVETLRTADVSNVVAMHDLRIAFKRLRYAVEALGPVLSPELRSWGQVATKFQKILGNLHDQDMALESIRADQDLSDDTRGVVLKALDQKRAQYAEQYLVEVGFDVAVPAIRKESLPKDDAPPQDDPCASKPSKGSNELAASSKKATVKRSAGKKVAKTSAKTPARNSAKNKSDQQ